MIVARLESTKELSCIIEKLENLNYTTTSYDKNSGFVYNKNNSHSDLTRDIKSAKTACKFTTSIKIQYGTNQSTI